jgi:hypothetical protein
MPNALRVPIALVLLAPFLGQNAPPRPAAPAQTLPTAATAPASAISITEGKTDLTIQIDGKPFTTYRFAPTPDDPHWRRPYFWPVLAADGAEVTSDQARLAEKDPKADHPHQRSIWVGHGDVNGANHWTEGPEQQRHVRFTRIQGDTFIEELTWDAKGGGGDGKDGPPPVLTETRTIKILSFLDGARGIELTSAFTAANGDVDFKCKPLDVSGVEAGLCSVRLAKEITDGPASTKWITSSAPATTEADARAKRASWCDYSGLIHDRKYGVAIVNWPLNPGGDRPWHVRLSGLLAWIGPNNWTLPSHTTATFKHLIIVHDGDADTGNVSVKARAWRRR